MILNRVEDKDMHNTMELPVLDLPKLGIAPEHYEAIDKAVKELSRQGIAIEVKNKFLKYQLKFIKWDYLNSVNCLLIPL